MKSAGTSTGNGMPGQRFAGPGCLIAFRCADCDKPKSTMGRKKRRHGFICAGCVQLRYEAAKQAWLTNNPDASPEQYEQACNDIAGRLGL